MYLTNVARLDMGSGYAATLLTSAEPVERVKERIQWLKDNGYRYVPIGIGRAAELDSWTPLAGPVPTQGSAQGPSDAGPPPLDFGP